jgi:hypothetical protein
VQDFVAQCCKLETMVCADDCQCCGSLRCQNGRCVPAPNVCHSLGDGCDDGEPCCPGAGTCIGGQCCRSDGGSCPVGCSQEQECAACCAGYCRDDGRCGPPQGCQQYGQACTAGTGECCNAVPCTNGRCRYP